MTSLLDPVFIAVGLALAAIMMYSLAYGVLGVLYPEARRRRACQRRACQRCGRKLCRCRYADERTLWQASDPTTAEQDEPGGTPSATLTMAPPDGFIDTLLETLGSRVGPGDVCCGACGAIIGKAASIDEFHRVRDSHTCPLVHTWRRLSTHAVSDETWTRWTCDACHVVEHTLNGAEPNPLGCAKAA